ncbi:TetR/AcrR family transcriptional regulator [Algivirga pacifica]|uniref:TetR/AcrR family transcriptional regulator n=1 Tax=Algivirga pacifica TaxID=1162670 RepID=A0ABP9D8S9_9BACT
MPKQTFLNLEEGKRKRITDAFLREFAIKPFDEASITVVVKQLGIAKGSVYQYFEGKQDLFMYLVQQCSMVKHRYVASVNRSDYEDFWTYFRALYEYGFQFDSENPLESHFLHNLAENLDSPSIKHLYKEMLQQAVRAFEDLVTYEVEQGLFRKDISIKTMGFQLYKAGVSIQEYLLFTGVINPQQSIQKEAPVFQGKKQEMLQVVDEYIQLLRPAFNKL